MARSGTITRSIYNKTGFPMSQSGLYVDVIIIAVTSVVFSWETSLLAFLALLIAPFYISPYCAPGCIVKFIINRIDPDAFMVVGVSQQIWGGYTLKKKKNEKIASDHGTDR